MECRQTTLRFPVASENAQATLVSGRRRIPVQIVDVSLHGFTVTVHKRFLCRMQFNRPLKIIAGQEQCLVAGELLPDESRSVARLHLERLFDISPEPFVKRAWRLGGGRNTLGTNSSPEVLLGILLFSLIGILALPGVGDRLGTTQKIRAGISTVVQWVTE